FFACLAVSPYMYYMYKKHPFYRWIHLDEDPDKKRRNIGFLLCIVLGVLVSVFLNNLFNMLSLSEVATGYTSVAESFYTGRLLFELLALGVVSPIAEELMFRGVMFGYLRRSFPKWMAFVFSSLLFGLIHMNLIQFLYAFIFGFLLCVVIEELDTVVASILMHGSANMISIITQEMGISTITGKIPVDVAVLLILALVSGLIFRYIIRDGNLPD
nr:CPBP family intramembrane metalloprotease [Lachnospiraceae bacterium]